MLLRHDKNPALHKTRPAYTMRPCNNRATYMHSREWGEHLPDEPKPKAETEQEAHQRQQREQERLREEAEEDLSRQPRKETEQEAYQRRQREEERRRKENEPRPLTALELEDAEREERRRQEAGEQRRRIEQSIREGDDLRKAQKEDERARAEYAQAQEDALDERLKLLTEAALGGLGDKRAEERRAQKDRDADPKVRAEREKKLREIQDEAWREEDRREREEYKAHEKEYQALKAERAPQEAVRSLMTAKTELDLGDGVSVDLGTAIPRLVEQLRNGPDGAPAAEALESGLKALEKVATDALMYGGDYAASLDALSDSLKQKAYSESRRHKLDIAALGAPASAAESAAAKEAPRDQLEAALAENGISTKEVETLIDSLPPGGLISERRMLENTLRSIKHKIESGQKDDEGLRGEIFHFVSQMKSKLQK